MKPNALMIPRASSGGLSGQRSRNGFTFLELVVILSVLALLIPVMATALGGTKADSRAFRCRNNLRQMMHAVILYTYDYHELFPPNPDDGTITPGYTWCGGQAGMGGADEFNPDLLSDPKRSLLAPYLNFQPDVFRCTADPRSGRYDGAALYPNSPLIGTKVPAARGISMNNAVGTVDPCFSTSFGHCGIPNLPTNGPWLTGVHGGNSASRGPWRTYGKSSQMSAPTPSALWVLTEESPFSINDALLAMSVGTPVWVDYPSTLHNSSCALAFGDGHCESHRWVESTTALTGPGGIHNISAGDPDWSWLAARTSAPK